MAIKKCILLLSLFACFACHMDTDDFIENIVEVQRLQNVYLNGALLYSFEYYSNNKIKTQQSYYDGAIFSVTHVEYSKDTVSKRTTGLFSSISKSYRSKSNEITLLEFDNQENLLTYYINTYSSSNCGLTKTKKYTRYGNLYSKTEYDYLDSNCSYNASKTLFNGVVKNNYAILRDNMNSYSASVNIWPEYASKHNVVEYRQWDKNDNLLLGKSYNASFIYDQNGYPIEEIRTSLTGTTKVYNYEYY